MKTHYQSQNSKTFDQIASSKRGKAKIVPFQAIETKIQSRRHFYTYYTMLHMMTIQAKEF